VLTAVGYTLLSISVIAAAGAEQAVALYLRGQRDGIDRLAILTHAAISLWCLIAGVWVLVWGR
jgi:hypothetical protein